MYPDACCPLPAARKSRPQCLLLAILLSALVASSSCAAVRRHSSPFPTPFGVAVGDVRVTAEQLDAIGPVWYLDYQWRGPALDAHERLYVIRSWEIEGDRGAIEAAMRASGSAWWSLGNEPNDPHQDNVSAEEYAALYHTFEGWAKGAPGCRIMPAGLANADWNWAETFREAFRREYGRYPRVDGWNVHDYILEPGLDPYDVNEFQRRILAFRRWMESIGDAQKPLFLTEFGVLYGSGCCNRPVDAPEKIRSFMRDAVAWLVSTDVVNYWAWFATYSDVYNGSLLTEDGQVNDLGAVYAELVREYQWSKGEGR